MPYKRGALGKKLYKFPINKYHHYYLARGKEKQTEKHWLNNINIKEKLIEEINYQVHETSWSWCWHQCSPGSITSWSTGQPPPPRTVDKPERPVTHFYQVMNTHKKVLKGGGKEKKKRSKNLKKERRCKHHWHMYMRIACFSFNWIVKHFTCLTKEKAL